jgi:hypothetical protein
MDRALACMGKHCSAYRISVRKYEVKEPLGRYGVDRMIKWILMKEEGMVCSRFI